MSVALGAASICFAPGVGAQPGPAPAPEAQPGKGKEPKDAPRQPALPDGERREVPSYDGREPAGASFGEALLWVPRVTLFPVHVVTEYVVRRPIGAFMVAAERGRWIQEVSDFFTFGPSNNIGVVPTALLDFGFRTSVGVYHFWDDFLMPGNAFRVHAAFGGTDWLRLTVADRVPIDDKSTFKVRFEASSRPDFFFFGIGPESRKDTASNYTAEWLDWSGTFAAQLKGASSLELYNAVRTVRFDPTCCGDERPEGGAVWESPALSERVRRRELDLPPGFSTGYTSIKQGIRLALDSRKPRPAPGTGARVDVGAEHAFDARDASSRWAHYGATLGGFLDLTGQNRVVSLSVHTSFSDPLGDRDVPFTELVQLGGDQPMRGFRAGRLMGRSAAVATLEYRWPIWAILDGSAQVAMGNVFGAHLEDFDADLMRLAFTFGIRTAGERDHSFDILVGSGTETFREGAGLNSLRLVIGATRHF